MPPFLRPAVVVLLAAGLAACVPETDAPAGTASPDPALAGSWQGTLNASQTALLHIAPAPGGTNLDFLQVWTEPGKGGQMQAYTGFPSACGKVQCLSVTPMRWVNEDLPVNAQRPASKRGYVVRYAVSEPDTLTLWTMSEDAVAAAIRAGAVKGVAPDKGTPVLTASPDELAAFIAAADPAVLFSNRYGVFRRIPPPR